jgi:type I restriction-modification system DNA methylase subunit
MKSKIDRIWDSFWTEGVSNPLEVMEQITYLLFIKRLDDLQTLEENEANRTGKPIDRRTFPEGKDPKKRSYELAQWNKLNQPNGVSRGFPAGFADRTAQSFCLPKSDIVEQGYDLSINRYKEVVHEEVNHRAPQAILDELESIEKEITQGMEQLRGMLK